MQKSRIVLIEPFTKNDLSNVLFGLQIDTQTASQGRLRITLIFGSVLEPVCGAFTPPKGLPGDLICSFFSMSKTLPMIPARGPQTMFNYYLCNRSN